MIVFGHRGAPSLAQENTIESFKLALSHNVDGLEFDVQLTLSLIHISEPTRPY